VDEEQGRGERSASLGEQLASGDELERVTWPLERLHELRDERLRDVVAHAKEHSRWHADRLRHVDVELLTAATNDRIPVMSKAVHVWFGDATPDATVIEALQQDLASALAAAGLVDPHVAVQVVDHPVALPRTPAGKRRPIVPTAS
jgi:hypothetical protein